MNEYLANKPYKSRSDFDLLKILIVLKPIHFVYWPIVSASLTSGYIADPSSCKRPGDFNDPGSARG